MLKKFSPIVGKLEDKKWLIAGISAGIAIAAAVISIFVYFSKREDEVEEDCFAE